MLSLLSRSSLTSASVTGLGIPGIDCMTFNTRQRPTFDINIRSSGMEKKDMVLRIVS